MIPRLSVDHRVCNTDLRETCGTESTAVAPPTRPAAGAGIVAAMGNAVIKTESEPLPDDIGLGHRLQRRVDPKSPTADAVGGGQRRQPLERGNEL